MSEYNRVYINLGQIPIDRQEVDQPEIIYLSPPPEYPFREIVSRSRYYDSIISETDTELNFDVRQLELEKNVFVYTELVMMKWNQRSVSDGISFGNYIQYINYICLPRGMNILDLFQDHLSSINDIPLENNMEILYRRRVIDLESQLRSLQERRVILPMEDIDDIHNGIGVCNGKPIKAEYFDEEMFKLEE